MTQKILAGITLISYLVFSWSCVIYRWKKEPLQSIEPAKREGARVSAVQKKSGERIDFNKDLAARIQADSVVGDKFIRDISIEKSKIEEPKALPRKTPFDLTTSEGKSYRVTWWTEAQDRVILHAYVPFSIMPLSDVDFVWIRKVNLPATILVIVAIPLAIVGFYYVMAYFWGPITVPEQPPYYPLSF
jgi:hypothetical protein